jgi:hypothetical protein
MEEKILQPLRVSTGEVVVTILSEPGVVFTQRRGYAPVVRVRLETGEERNLFIGAISLGTPLNNLQKANSGRLTGLKVGLRKESDDRFAPFIVREVSA